MRRVRTMATHVLHAPAPSAASAAAASVAASLEAEGVRIASRSVWRQPPARAAGVCKVACPSPLTPEQIAAIEACGDVQVPPLPPCPRPDALPWPPQPPPHPTPSERQGSLLASGDPKRCGRRRRCAA